MIVLYANPITQDYDHNRSNPVFMCLPSKPTINQIVKRINQD